MNTVPVVEEHWVIRPRPSVLFFYAAIVTTLLFALGVVANFIMAYRGTIPIPETLPFKVFGAILGVVGASAALWLWVGMCWYWFQLDPSSRQSKIFWFIALLLGNWAGATAYYFLVYRRVNRPRQSGPP